MLYEYQWIKPPHITEIGKFYPRFLDEETEIKGKILKSA